MEPSRASLSPDSGLALSALLAAVTEPIVVFSAEGRVVECNESAARLHGHLAEALRGRSLAEFMAPPMAEERSAIIQEVAQVGRPITLIERLGGYFGKTVFRRVAGRDGWLVLATTLLGCARPMVEAASVEPAEPARIAQHDDPAELASLTPREMRVLRLLALGKTQEQIGKNLGRSTKTVEWHRSSIGRKLGRHTVVDLARFAVERGLLMVPEAAFSDKAALRTGSAQVHLG